MQDEVDEEDQSKELDCEPSAQESSTEHEDILDTIMGETDKESNQKILKRKVDGYLAQSDEQKHGFVISSLNREAFLKTHRSAGMVIAFIALLTVSSFAALLIIRFL